MAKLGFTHNAGDIPDADTLPDGWYTAEIVKSEMRDASENAKDPNGRYLYLEFKLTEDNKEEHVGRVVFDRVTLVNKNETAVRIGKRSLDQMIRAVGLQSIDDSDELHGRPMAIKVKTRPGRDGYDPSNEIKAYKPADSVGAQGGGGGWM